MSMGDELSPLAIAFSGALGAVVSSEFNNLL